MKLITLIIIMSTIFVACKKDDDEDSPVENETIFLGCCDNSSMRMGAYGPESGMDEAIKRCDDASGSFTRGAQCDRAGTHQTGYCLRSDSRLYYKTTSWNTEAEAKTSCENDSGGKWTAE